MLVIETGQDDAKKGAEMEQLQQGEEIDIDLDDPSTADAAVKIQAVFRGHQSRREIKQNAKENEAATKIQAGFRGHQTRKGLNELKAEESTGATEEENKGDERIGHDEEKQEYGVDNINAEDDKYGDEKYGEAATKIQAGFRGYKTREELKTKSNGATSQEINQEQKENKESGIMKEEEEAAVKIQASFRGLKARKEVEAIRSLQSIGDGGLADVGGKDASEGEAYSLIVIQSI